MSAIAGSRLEEGARSHRVATILCANATVRIREGVPKKLAPILGNAPERLTKAPGKSKAERDEMD